MNPLPTLDALTGEPQLVETIEGRPYSFSELTLEALGRLQAWIKSAVPHPIEAIKPHLDGLPESDRRRLLDQAVAEARYWPPRIGTPAASLALLGTQEGQLRVLLEALRAQDPAATEAEAGRLYQALTREVKRDAARQARERRDAALEAARRAEAGLPPAPAPGPGRDPEARVGRIYGVLFGTYDPAEGEGPKAPAGEAGPST